MLDFWVKLKYHPLMRDENCSALAEFESVSYKF